MISAWEKTEPHGGMEPMRFYIGVATALPPIQTHWQPLVHNHCGPAKQLVLLSTSLLRTLPSQARTAVCGEEGSVVWVAA